MSITAEKIALDAAKLPKRVTDEEAHAIISGPEKWSFIKGYAYALLQQGEPEGWQYIADEALRKYAKTLRVSEAKRPGSTYGMLKPEAVEEAADCLKNSFLSASPLPPAPGAETGETTDKVGGFDGTGIYKRSIAPDPIAGQGDARSLDIKRDWCIEAAKREGDAEVGAGYHSLPEAVAALSSRQAVLEETLLSLCSQIERDLKSAHAEICKLQRIDPKTHTWPEWSPQANTLRWVKKIRSEIIDDASYADLRASGGIFAATTPPAEGETK